MKRWKIDEALSTKNHIVIDIGMDGCVLLERHVDGKDGYDMENARLIAAAPDLLVAMNTCKNDYWFMINLIERYSSDKDQALKDCLERMKFRKPMFDVLAKVEGVKE